VSPQGNERGAFSIDKPSLMGYCAVMNEATRQYASEFARLGGLTKSEARAAASRRNGRLGGRPKKTATPAEKTSGKGQPDSFDYQRLARERNLFVWET
jgi:hypothetical protein